MLISPSKFFFLILLLFSSSVHCEQGLSNVFSEVIEPHIKLLEDKEAHIDTNDYSFFLKWLFEQQSNLSPRKKREKAFSIVKPHFPFDATEKIIDKHSYEELEFFKGKNDPAKSVVSAVDRTFTEVGKGVLYSFFATPTTNSNLLKQRQGILKIISNNNHLQSALSDIFRQFAAHENLLYSFWGEDLFRQTVQRERTFNLPFCSFLNEHSWFLELKNLLDHQREVSCISLQTAGSLFAFLASLMILKGGTDKDTIISLAHEYQVGDAITNICAKRLTTPFLKSVAHLTAGITGALFLKGNWQWVKSSFLLDKLLYKKVQIVGQTVDLLKKLYYEISISGCNTDDFLFFKDLENFFSSYKRSSQKLNSLLETFEKPPFKGKNIPLIYAGRIVLAYKYMYEVREYFEKALCALGELDAYLSMSTLLKESSHKKVHFCFTQFDAGLDPFLKISGFWHPLVDAEKVVPNSLACEDVSTRKFIITGPNAGGKSTILKSLSLVVLFSQVFGVAPAKEVVCTPFDSLITSFDVVDDLSNGSSLFKNEILRAHHIIATLQKSLEKNKKCFIVLDEMCRGTSPYEGAAISYSLAEHIGKYPNSIALLATHYDLLVNLEKESLFQNYTVSIFKNTQGTLEYPFTLKKGVGERNVALDIIRAEGIASSIIDKAEMLIQQKG